MPYRVILTLKTGKRMSNYAWASPRQTPVIGQWLELSSGAHTIRALVKGIAKAPAVELDAEGIVDLVLAREV